MENFLNTIFGCYCVICGKPGSMFCFECSQHLSVMDMRFCPECNKPNFSGNTHKNCFEKNYLSSNFSCFKCEGIVEKIIKNSRNPPYEYGAFEVLVSYAVRYAIQTGLYISDYEIMPLPFSKKEINRIGYNPGLVIYKEFKKQFGLQLAEGNNVPKRVLIVTDVFEESRAILDFSNHLHSLGVTDIKSFTVAWML